MTIRRRIYYLIEASHPDHTGSRMFDIVMVALIVANVLSVILETVPGLDATHGDLFHTFDRVSVAVFTAEYLARLWVAVEHPPVARHGAFLGRLRFAMGPYLLIDLLAIIPFYLSLLMPAADLRVLRIFRLLRMLKLARYSPGLNTLMRVLAEERRALGAALVVMLGLLVVCSTIVFHLEHAVQPDKFASIPHAMWWGLATLTTVGYGDVVPVTALGKIVGGTMMIFGLGMFAIPIGIIASAFSRDIHQRDFVISFGMVSGVPAFSHLDPVQIEQIVRRLQSRRLPAGSTVFTKGDPADAMYFILSGTVRVHLPGRAIDMGVGEFFGEMALYRDAPRLVRVHCLTDCRLLRLAKGDFDRLSEDDADFRHKIETAVRERRAEQEAEIAKDPRA
ncbi:cyclic nucleotide-gated ion channel [Thalassospiraceae bacterium LMO-SO8]|nr:cyclic nucleotide-gated ion channel/potassium channel family protein [Alphaproteobacteria bacterium LMO-S08]WND74511.1 cyclic nucleotide-gated ion channel [Thalassospiraceae bacterium LMO-SO8]